MTDSTASSTNEKATVVHNKANKGGFLLHKKPSPFDENLEKPAELSADVKPQENDAPPISLLQLFRYVFLLFSCISWLITT